MTVIICLDDNNGMLFNKRRQSSDVLLRKSVLDLIGDKKLYMNEYSKKQFIEEEKNIIVKENFLKLATDDDYCFVENKDLSEYLNKIESFVIYRWNRVYPSDYKFDLRLLDDFLLTSTTDFAGNSHEKITMEVYCRA